MTLINQEDEQKKEDLTYNRPNFWVTTRKKRLNFVQQIKFILKTIGMTAVLLPGNLLFECGPGETLERNY